MDSTLLKSKQQFITTVQQNKDNGENQYNKNLILLTTQVERLTVALQKKSQEVELLQNQMENNNKPNEQVNDIEQLIITVEEQTKEIEKLAEKYQQLQDKYQQSQQKNSELQQVVNLLQNRSSSELKSLENIQPIIQVSPTKRIQYSQANDKRDINQDPEKLNSFYSLQFQNKSEENQQLRLQLSQLQQQLIQEKQIHNELLQAEEQRVKEKEKQNLIQYKQEVKEQLLLYKNQINALQDMLDNKQFNQLNQENEEKIIKLNLLLSEKNKVIDKLEAELCNKENSIIILQNQLEKQQKEQVAFIKQQQQLKQSQGNFQSLRIGSSQVSQFNFELRGGNKLDTNNNNNNNNNNLYSPNAYSTLQPKVSSIQEQINQTMSQINKSIQQVDQMKQTNQANQKLFSEEFRPKFASSSRNQYHQNLQSNTLIQDKIKTVTQLTQQSKYI